MTKWSPEHHRRRARRRCVRLSFVECVPGQKRANGEGEEEARLTRVAASAGASSGVVGAEQNGEGDLRGRSWGRRGRGRLQGGRALGARPVRSSRGRRRLRTPRRGSGTTVGVASTTVRARRRRPWRGESEGEELGRGGGVCEVGATCVTEPGFQGGEGRKQGGGQLRGARRGRRRAPACLPGRAKQLAGAAAGLGRQVGRVAPGKFSLSLSSFFYFLFCFISFASLFN